MWHQPATVPPRRTAAILVAFLIFLSSSISFVKKYLKYQNYIILFVPMLTGVFNRMDRFLFYLKSSTANSTFLFIPYVERSANIRRTPNLFGANNFAQNKFDAISGKTLCLKSTKVQIPQKNCSSSAQKNVLKRTLWEKQYENLAKTLEKIH